MKKPIAIIAILAVLGGIAYGLSSWNSDPKIVSGDPCGVDYASAFIYDIHWTIPEADVARMMLTQYLDALKELDACPRYQISDYEITFVGDVERIGKDFEAGVRFDIKPVDMEAFELDTPETTVDGEWVRGKQATLGIIRSPGSVGTTTSSYQLAI